MVYTYQCGSQSGLLANCILNLLEPVQPSTGKEKTIAVEVYISIFANLVSKCIAQIPLLFANFC
jgi:hypothetical protein